MVTPISSLSKSSVEDLGFLEDFETEEIGVTLKDFDIDARIMKHEDFRFRSFILSFLSHRKHHTVKGGRGKTKEKFRSDVHLKILHLPILSSEAIGNLIQFSQFLQ